MTNGKRATLWLTKEELVPVRKLAKALGILQSHSADELGSASALVRRLGEAYKANPQGTADALRDVLAT